MAGIPVPSIPAAQRKCYRVSWPEGEEWRAVLLGMLTRPLTPKFWSGNIDDIEDCQENILEALGETLEESECDIMPIGGIIMWYAATLPVGFMLCNGDTFDALTYPELNTVLGGNTLPDMRARVPVGLDEGGNEFAVIGNFGGTVDVTLDTTQIPPHTHGITDGVFTAAGPSSDNRKRALAGSNGFSGSAGGGLPHSNLQPYRVVSFIIRAI